MALAACFTGSLALGLLGATEAASYSLVSWAVSFSNWSAASAWTASSGGCDRGAGGVDGGFGVVAAFGGDASLLDWEAL